jgi:tetratricopeptide (TPR) repeat protein
MITLRYLALALLVCVAALSGCSNEQPAEQAVLDNGAPAPSGELAPPSPASRFKAERLARALRGLTYEDGRVAVDEASAEPLPDAESFATAADAHRRGLEYLFEVNDRVAAIGALSRAVIMAPDNPDYLADLGQALLRKGKRDEAMAAFNTALDIEPRHLPAQRQAAFALQMGGDYEASRQAWRKVLDIDATDGEAWGRLAIVEYYLEDYAGAWEHVRRARDHGYRMPAQFLPLLEAKMPEPANA